MREKGPFQWKKHHSGYERYPGNYRRYTPQSMVQSKGLLMRTFLRAIFWENGIWCAVDPPRRIEWNLAWRYIYTCFMEKSKMLAPWLYWCACSATWNLTGQPIKWSKLAKTWHFLWTILENQSDVPNLSSFHHRLRYHRFLKTQVPSGGNAMNAGDGRFFTSKFKIQNLSPF
jgi:hypothetical protein